jgi:hypothetical protein
MHHVIEQMQATKTAAPQGPANTAPTTPPSPSPGETLGRILGRALAPIAHLAARVRRGPALHLAGTVCAGEVIAAADDPVLAPLAHRLAGAAVVRLSGALWRRPGPPELLGCAIRFRNDRPLAAVVAPEDQDLLFATVRRLWLLVPAMFRTRRGDYLHNAYYTASPLELPGLGFVEFRLVPIPAPIQPGETRDERLDAAMQSGAARLRLELKRERRVWQHLCDVRLRGRLELDEQLSFTPFHMGQGLRPRGFIQAMRAAIYTASQSARASL